MIWYLTELNSIVNYCEDFKKDVIEFAFNKGKEDKPYTFEYCWTPRYQSQFEILYGVVKISDMLGIEYLDENIDDLCLRVSYLNNPSSVDTKNRFEIHIDYIINKFSIVENEIKKKLSLLEKEEKRRLNEAVNCYLQSCNYSAVAMAVSAIESRLYSLMMKKCPDAKLDTLTLGLLIREYLDNPKKYKNCIPKKHKHLLEHCNIYRIFSVHPTKEKVTRSAATSIINMTFGFLLDEELKHTIEKV